LGVRRNRIVTRRPDELTRSAPKAKPEDALYVYKREHCRWCGSPLDVLTLAGRRTWACPVHQT
jgi:formamidopyrimidine-DNA glycosylase